jgi:hydroxyethylthiazole kinase-like uncharacterized protein yjeF
MRAGSGIDHIAQAAPVILLVTADEMRRIESYAVSHGATWEGLMEAAGRGIAEAIYRRYENGPPQRALVLCGPGNNGGDGLVVARHMAEFGWEVKCLTWNRPADGDERLRQPLAAHKVPISPIITQDLARTALDNALEWCTLVVDALLGTGIKRDVQGDLASIITNVVRSGRAVVAADIPTGVDSDTGAMRGTALPADYTMAVGHFKYGHFIHPGKQLRGEIELEEIGLDATKSREVAKGELLTEALVSTLLPKRPEDSNKGTFGKAFIVAGSINFIGAAALATQGAMRSGVGLVTLGCPGDLLVMLAAKLTECTFLPLPSDMGAVAAHAAEKLMPELNEYDALLVGSGLGTDKATATFLHSLFAHPNTTVHTTARPIGFASQRTQGETHTESAHALPPLVLDGDALNLLAQWEEWWSVVPPGGVLTPHPGEMARLLGSTVDEVQSDRVGVARTAAAKWQHVVVLKGAATVIASPEGRIFVSPFSNPALATAGTGDVLAGAIVGLLAQGLKPVDAACAGVYLHGLAGEYLREEFGVAGGLAGDLPVLLARAQQKVRDGGNKRSS